MARKKSLGCGTVIIGLIALAMAAKYWYVLVAIGFAALVIWGIVKLTRSWSTPETLGKNLEFQRVMASASIADTPTPVIEQDTATVRAADEVAIKQQAAEKAAIHRIEFAIKKGNSTETLKRWGAANFWRTGGVDS